MSESGRFSRNRLSSPSGQRHGSDTVRGVPLGNRIRGTAPGIRSSGEFVPFSQLVRHVRGRIARENRRAVPCFNAFSTRRVCETNFLAKRNKKKIWEKKKKTRTNNFAFKTERACIRPADRARIYIAVVATRHPFSVNIRTRFERVSRAF